MTFAKQTAVSQLQSVHKCHRINTALAKLAAQPKRFASKGLSALDPDSIHIDLTPQSSLRTNWIATGLIHFDPVRTTNLTCDDSYTRPNYRHVIAHLPLAVTQSCFRISHPAGFGHCLLPPYIQQRVRFLYSPTIARHLLQTRASINEYACHVITSFPVAIHFRSRSNPPTRCGLA